MKKKLKSQPVSTRHDKITFIRSSAQRIVAVQTDAEKSTVLVQQLADEMLQRGLYLKTTARIDRCTTVFKLIRDLGFWENAVVKKVSELIWERK